MRPIVFEDHVAPPNANGCRLWIDASYHRQGYGWARGGKLAHRVAWERAYGPIPPGKCVLHHCDTPPCVEPTHLFLGTQLDNMRDRSAKGRQVQGEAQPNHKLSVEQVRAIRASSGTQVAVAAEFGISPSHVWQIRNGGKWKSVEHETSQLIS